MFIYYQELLFTSEFWRNNNSTETRCIIMEIAQFSRHKPGKLSQKMNNHHAYPYGKGVLITNLEELDVVEWSLCVPK
jgi:hypothetical protein